MPAQISRPRLTGYVKAFGAGTRRTLCRWAPPQDGWRILLYHTVTPERVPDRWGRAVPAELFARHLAHLAQEGYRVLPVRQVIEQLRAGRAIAARTVSVTFDDGYAGTWRLAAPAMARHGWAGTVFVTTDWVQADEGQGNGSAWEAYLSWSQLVKLAEAGWEIGSHGCSHRPLAAMPGPDLQRELASSRRHLKERLQHDVSSFSFPHGVWTPAVAGQVEANGYASACTSDPGVNVAQTSRYQLRRLEMTAWDTVRTLALKVQGHYDWLGALRRC